MPDSDKPEATLIAFEEVNLAEPKGHRRTKWHRREIRFWQWALIVFGLLIVLFFVVIVPIIIKVVIPHRIRDDFDAALSDLNNKLHISQLILNDFTPTGLHTSVVASLAGVNIPFGWTATIQALNVHLQTTSDLANLAELDFSSDIHVGDGYVKFNDPDVFLLASNVSNEARFVPAFIGAALTSAGLLPGNETVPVVRVTTTLNTKVGFLWIPGVHVEQDVDLGQLLPRN
ncbi:hypothetical protein BDK51DRAFT_28606, partial [Blyttiomyces helicus]